MRDVLKTIGQIHESALLEEAGPNSYVQHSVVDLETPSGTTVTACALCNDLKEFVDEVAEKAVTEDREHQPAYQWALGERNLLIAALKGQEYLGERYNPPTEALKDLTPFTGDRISHRLKIETEALGKIRQSVIDLKTDVATIAEGSFTLATRMSDSLSRIVEAVDILVHK